MANNIEKQLKEISERLEQGVKEIFTSERYTEYVLCKIFHTSILAFSLLFLSYVKSVCLLCCDISRFINISYI